MIDKKKGILNVEVSIAFRILILITSLITRRYLIKYIGNDANGIESLYVSIIGFLSVVELGVGSAIAYCMYKPIVENDNDKVSALYFLFKKLYFIIGLIIFICGCLLLPFLKIFAKGYEKTDINLYISFGIMLFSVVLTYFYSAKISLFNAYKNNYIATSITSCGLIFQNILQIIVLLVFKSFTIYLCCRIISVLFQWLITEIICRKSYNKILDNKQDLDQETKSEVVKNVKAMFMHKIGGILVNTADSVIISAFIGVVILGKYSNYTVIVTAMIGVISLFFTPLSSIIGHMFVSENLAQTKKYHNFFHTLNFIIGIIFLLGYYAIINDLIVIFFGKELHLSESIVVVITVNYFIQFMRHSTGIFRDATGTFYYDRWKPLCEGLFNIALSILFVVVFPPEYKVVGVIVATIITNLFICHIVEPHVLYKYAFRTSTKNYYIRNYIYMAIFLAALAALHFAMVEISNPWLELLANGGIAVGIAIVPCIAVVLFDKDFRLYLKKFFKRKETKQEE